MSARPLIFAEKPSQAMAYGSAFSIEKRDKSSITLKKCSTFPDGAVITWGIGHLVELYMPADYDEKYKRWDIDNLPIIPKPFLYRPRPDLKEHFAHVEQMFYESDFIIIASDQDREGEAIAWLVIEYLNINKPIKRLWINSLEPDAIREGFNNLRDGKETYNLYLEARARQHADWLVGMNLSPLFSLSLNNFKGYLNIGRVLVPTTKMIYDRQKEIENFVSKPFYELYGTFNHENGSYVGKADIKTFKKEEIEDVYRKYNLQDKDNGYIQSVETKEKKQLSPKLHSLSTLQTKANKLWKYSPSDTLKIVQTLYEKYKIVSYPRTDSNYITDNEFAYLSSKVKDYQNILNIHFEANTEPSKRYIRNDLVEEHYALIPTKTIPSAETLDKLNEKERNIYYEILKTTLAMFHSDYIYEETTIVTNVKDIEFKTTGKVEKQKGWKGLINETKSEKQENEGVLPAVQKNDEVPCAIETKEKFTTAPKPYTLGQMISLMKTAGKFVENEEDSEILKNVEGTGTEATRAGIIEKIIQQEYISVQKNIVSITNKGIILCEATDGTLLSSPSMTAKWESYLQRIGKGQGDPEHFIKNIINFINKMIDEIPEKLKDHKVIAENVKEHQKVDGIVDCPSCKGQILDKKGFYGCSGYKEGCKVTFPKKIANKTITKSMIKSLCTKGKTNKLKGFKGKKGDFSAALILDEKYKIKFDFAK